MKTTINKMTQKKSDLEKEMEKVFTQLGIPSLEKYGTTPGIGNCWYEAISSLMQLHNMRKLSAKQLREEVIDNIEQSENIKSIRENLKDHKMTIEEFKERHRKEGAFTDEDGIMVLTTAMYLGITLRIISRTNTRETPYTEYNENKSVTFYIFFDERSPGHFQSLRNPKKKTPQNRYSLGDSSENESNMDEILNKESSDDVEMIDKSQENKIKTCDKCQKTFPNIKYLRDHHLRHDKLQCVFCHEEVSKTYDLNIHEEIHRDTEGYYKCEICEDKYKSVIDARLHAYCHNPFEILEEIKRFEVNLYHQMFGISPDIMAQSRNEFLLKEQNESIKKDEEEAKNRQNEKPLKKAEEEAIKNNDEPLKKAMKEAAKVEAEEFTQVISLKQKKAIKKAKEEDIKRKNEESQKKAKEEALKKAKEEEASKKAKKEALQKAEEEAIKRKNEESQKKAEEVALKAKEDEIKRKKSLKKAEEEAIKRENEESLRRAKNEAIKRENEESLKKAKEEAKKEKERQEELIKEAKEAQMKLEESKNKAKEETLKIKKDLEDSRRKAEEETLKIKKAEEEKQKEIKEKAKQEEERIALIEEERDLEEKRTRRRIFQAEEDARKEKEKQEELIKRATEEALETEKKLEESKNKAKKETLKIEKDLEDSRKKAEKETLEIKNKLEESVKKAKEEKDLERLQQEELLKKATEAALEKKKEYEKKIKQEELKKESAETTLIGIKTMKSDTCWNCLDNKCPSYYKKKGRKELKTNKEKNIIETTLKNKKELSKAEKASLLESMAKHNEEKEDKWNMQCALYKIPPKSKTRKPETKKTREWNISIAKKGIAETIENNSEMGRADAMEILEIIKDSQEDLDQPENEKETEDLNQPGNEEKMLSCPAACEEKIELDNYIDHILECETKIEECWRCGEEYKNNDVHRSLEKHSTPEQRFACMTCMRAHATRIRIVSNHKYICLGPGTRKDLVNEQTPEVTGEEMQQAYDESKLIKKLLKEDFRKRNRKHRKNKNNSNPLKAIIAVLSTISLIYMILFIMMKSTEETGIRSKIQDKKIIKDNIEAKNSIIQNRNNLNGNTPNQIKESKTTAEDTIKKKALKNMIEESITVIKNQNKCSEQMANQAINAFLKKQEQRMEAEVMIKINNLKRKEAELEESIANAQTAAGIIKNNREILEDKLNSPEKTTEPDNTAYSEKNKIPQINTLDIMQIRNPNKDQQNSFDLEHVLSKVLELQSTQRGKPAKNENSKTNLVNNDCIRNPNKNQENQITDAEIGDVNYSSWKITDLKKEMQAKDLPVSGRKEELVERLMGHSSTNANVLNKDDDLLNADDNLLTDEPVKKAEEELTAQENKSPKKKIAINRDVPVPAPVVTDEKTKGIRNNDLISKLEADSTQTETPAQIKNLLTEIQDDLINLEYVKNYNNPEESETEKSQDSINSTTYFLVKDNTDHMLISNLDRITFRNPQINIDIEAQMFQTNPSQLRVMESPSI